MDGRIEECSKAYGTAEEEPPTWAVEVGAKEDHVGKRSQTLKGKGRKGWTQNLDYLRILGRTGLVDQN